MPEQVGYLVLENGAVFTGKLIGSTTPGVGEVVFNTSMVGYEQILTDPSYAGQIVVMTYPLIGNYGVNRDNLENKHSYVKGFIITDLCQGSQHYEQQMSLAEYFREEGITCLAGVDTRAITRVIRTSGTMGGVITSSLDNYEELQEAARTFRPPQGGYVRQVTRKNSVRLGRGQRRLVLVDFGTKKSIVDALLGRECEVIVVPADTTCEAILACKPDGVVLSNGPGDPQDCPYAVAMAKELLGKVPVFGICLGHQLLGLALGGTTRKMVFGHRGGNQPVKDIRSGRVYITSQNHGYMVDEESLAGVPVDVVFRNLNDGTVEGLLHREIPMMSVQFHPEAAPGPEDTEYLMDDFIAMVDQVMKMKRAVC